MTEMTHKGSGMVESSKTIEDQPIRSIVLATDFFESSRLALDYAVAFAHHYSSKLTIVHAIELPPAAQEVEVLYRRTSVTREQTLSRLVALASGVRRLGIHTEIDLREGEPCPAVLDSAADNNADLLVLGTHGIYRGLEHVFIGSNAEKILLSAACPTLTVGRHVMAGIGLDARFRRILLVSDLSPESVAAAKYAVSFGQELGIEIEILPLAPDDEHDSEKVREIAERYCANLCLPSISIQEWCDPAYLQKAMTSAKKVLERAMTCADGLLILGVHGESSWKRHIHACFAFELVARSACPVITVHERWRAGEPAHVPKGSVLQ